MKCGNLIKLALDKKLGIRENKVKLKFSSEHFTECKLTSEMVKPIFFAETFRQDIWSPKHFSRLSPVVSKLAVTVCSLAYICRHSDRNHLIFLGHLKKQQGQTHNTKFGNG